MVDPLHQHDVTASSLWEVDKACCFTSEELSALEQQHDYLVTIRLSSVNGASVQAKDGNQISQKSTNVASSLSHL